MFNLKIAAINTGLKGHGHNIAIPPSGIMAVVNGIYYFLPESTKREIEIKIFDQVLLGDQIFQKLEKFQPRALLVSVQMSGYYNLALEIFKWANNFSIPILAGGQHFRVPDIINEKQYLPGTIAKIAAKKRGVIICYGEGEKTAALFINHLINNNQQLSSIPNICYQDDKRKLITTEQFNLPIGQLPYPTLPQSVIDLRDYWIKLSEENLIKNSGNDFINGTPIGRTMFGPDAIRGCAYRRGRILSGKENCLYCALTSKCARVSGERFWELTKQMIDYVKSIPFNGHSGIRTYNFGDDMGSNYKFINSVHKTMPEWSKNIPLGHRMYAWFIPKHLAYMLYDIGVRWLYIGADGKHGWTSEWSNNHPLVRTLKNCREVGLKAHVNFVLGQRNHSWESIDKWNKFRKKLRAEFKDTIMATDGWINVVVPGSSDWNLVKRHFPSLTETDCPDLETIRLIFWQNFTRLCQNESPEKVREKLYKISAEFEDSQNPKPLRRWMC